MILSPIGWETVDAWYELGYSPDGLTIRIHHTAAEEMRHMMPDSWNYAQRLGQQWELPDFIGANQDTWGYGPILQKHHTNGPWETWFVNWPEPPGTQDERWDRQEMLCVSATLHLLLGTFLSGMGSKWHETPRGTQPQLIDINCILLQRGGGAALSATISSLVADWVAAQPNESHPEAIGSAMYEVYSRLLGNTHDWDRRKTYARVHHPRWLHLNVPGDACGLDPHSMTERDCEEGYTLCPHNVDNRLQQLSLLAGLAKLHDVVREWQTSH